MHFITVRLAVLFDGSFGLIHDDGLFEVATITLSCLLCLLTQKDKKSINLCDPGVLVLPLRLRLSQLDILLAQLLTLMCPGISSPLAQV